MARWNKGADYLTKLSEEKGQDTPEFCHWLDKWLLIDKEYRQLENRIEMMKLTALIRRSADQ